MSVAVPLFHYRSYLSFLYNFCYSCQCVDEKRSLIFFLMNVFSAGSYTHFDICSICLTKMFGSDCTTTTTFLYILSVRWIDC